MSEEPMDMAEKLLGPTRDTVQRLTQRAEEAEAMLLVLRNSGMGYEEYESSLRAHFAKYGLDCPLGPEGE